MILKKILNFWKSEPHDSYKKNSYKKRVYYIYIYQHKNEGLIKLEGYVTIRKKGTQCTGIE